MKTDPHYSDPGMSGLTLDVTLTSAAPKEASFPMRMGVVLRRKRRGYVLPWGELVLHLNYLITHSPLARAQIREMVDRAETVPVRLKHLVLGLMELGEKAGLPPEDLGQFRDILTGIQAAEQQLPEAT